MVATRGRVRPAARRVYRVPRPNSTRRSRRAQLRLGARTGTADARDGAARPEPWPPRRPGQRQHRHHLPRRADHLQPERGGDLLVGRADLQRWSRSGHHWPGERGRLAGRLLHEQPGRVALFQHQHHVLRRLEHAHQQRRELHAILGVQHQPPAHGLQPAQRRRYHRADRGGLLERRLDVRREHALHRVHGNRRESGRRVRDGLLRLPRLLHRRGRTQREVLGDALRRRPRLPGGLLGA